MKRLIEELRLQLGDVDKLGYPDALLAEFVKDAMCLIVQLRPERFAKPVIMKASRGEVQCVSDCCSQLLSVDGVVDKYGNPLNYISEGDMSLAKAFTKESMAGTQTSYTFAMRDDAKGFFEVSPPIKPSDDVYFRITCVTAPDELGLGDTFDSCGYHELVINYALYRAYSMETESQTSIALGNNHLKFFYDTLSLERKVDKE